jgi:hypothetical protein
MQNERLPRVEEELISGSYSGRVHICRLCGQTSDSSGSDDGGIKAHTNTFFEQTAVRAMSNFVQVLGNSCKPSHSRNNETRPGKANRALFCGSYSGFSELCMTISLPNSKFI